MYQALININRYCIITPIEIRIILYLLLYLYEYFNLFQLLLLLYEHLF